MKDKEKKYKKPGPAKGTKRPTIAMRKRVVAEIDSGEYLIVQLAEKYGVSEATIRNWRYQVELHEGGPDPKEVDLDMQQVANEILDGVYTKKEAIEKYGFTKPHRIRYWVERIRKENWDARKRGKIPKSPISGMGKEKRSKGGENAALSKALEEAQLRVLALETLIEVAERELGVNIRKKPGTKRSKK